MEILSLRGVRTFRVRDQPGLRLETPTKHGEQCPVSRLAGRTAGGRDMHPTCSPDMAHLPISEKNEMGLEGRVCLQSWKVLEVNRAARTWKRLWDREGSPWLNQEVPVRLLFGAGRSAAGWQGSGQSSGSGIEPSFFFFWGGVLQLPQRAGRWCSPHLCASFPTAGFGEYSSSGQSRALKRCGKQGWCFLPSCSKRNRGTGALELRAGAPMGAGGTPPHPASCTASQVPQLHPALVPGDCMVPGSENPPWPSRGSKPREAPAGKVFLVDSENGKCK